MRASGESAVSLSANDNTWNSSLTPRPRSGSVIKRSLSEDAGVEIFTGDELEYIQIARE